MGHKVTIVGAGSVGATIAYTMLTRGSAAEIVLIDINKEKALGEAMDISQAAPFTHTANIYAGDYEDADNSDIVIITSGIARKPGQSRLELAQTNVNILKDISSNITKHAPNAIYIIVSNPVDVLTYAFIKASGIPEHQIIGSGTILDTSRLRAKLAEQYRINQKNVHAVVLGEHGDTSFVPWSVAYISNIPALEYYKYVEGKDAKSDPVDVDGITDFVRKSGGIIIKRKGATFHGVASSVCHICECIFSGMDTALSVSTMMHGEYGLDDVCLSTLAIVGKNGVTGKIHLPLTDEEVEKLHESANKLKEVIHNVNL